MSLLLLFPIAWLFLFVCHIHNTLSNKSHRPVIQAVLIIDFSCPDIGVFSSVYSLPAFPFMNNLNCIFFNYDPELATIFVFFSLNSFMKP